MHVYYSSFKYLSSILLFILFDLELNDFFFKYAFERSETPEDAECEN